MTSKAKIDVVAATLWESGEDTEFQGALRRLSKALENADVSGDVQNALSFHDMWKIFDSLDDIKAKVRRV